jgi:hypothetical protein
MIGQQRDQFFTPAPDATIPFAAWNCENVILVLPIEEKEEHTWH